MREKLAIFLDTQKNSGGAYQELVYMIDRLDSLYKGEIEIVIISNSTNLQININGSLFNLNLYSDNDL